jgi:tRNA(His) 5'-end guanylyltransferase
MSKLRDEIVKSHKSGEVAFHEAHERLMKECGMSSEDAHDILFPPFEEGVDFDYIPNPNLKEWMVE